MGQKLVAGAHFNFSESYKTPRLGVFTNRLELEAVRTQHQTTRELMKHVAGDQHPVDII